MNLRGRVELVLPSAVLVVLLWLSYCWFVAAPYTGFMIDGNQATIERGLFLEPAGGLRAGDQIVSINGAAWEELAADVTRSLFEGVRPGDVVAIAVIRNREALTVQYEMPRPTLRMVASRVVQLWWYGYIFWAAGTVTALMLRPKDERWRLLIAFYYLTAIWLVAGSGPSGWRVYGSGMVLRLAAISSVPVYLHLHWVFPQPLGRLPKWALWLLYGATGILLLLQLAQRIPGDTYLGLLLIAVVGSIILLLFHFVLRRAQRRSLAIMLVTAGIALAPFAVLLFMAAQARYPISGSAALLGLILIPFVYLLSAYRQQVAGMGLRGNRLLTFYLYIILLITLVALPLALVFAVTNDDSLQLLIAGILLILTGVLGALAYGPFQRLMERLFFGRQLASAGLLSDYSARVSTTLDRQSLVAVLRDELLPELLVKQSAVLMAADNQPPQALYAQGVAAGDLPTREQLQPLVEQAGRYRPPLTAAGPAHPAGWARLVLPLKLGEQEIGLWLLGRRDPDDIYSPSDISLLQTIANQAAIALTNITQAENLRAMYQANIDRHEQERARIAREIHDQLLHSAARLQWAVEEGELSPQAQQAYDDLVDQLRRTTAGLRPALLTYGLWTSLRQLVEDMQGWPEQAGVLQFTVLHGDHRYPGSVEQNLFRIVQEALVNAFRHAQAAHITISGKLTPNVVQLAVIDDGKGFDVTERGQLSELLAARHYGLWQMYERADLIGAELTIHSTPGAGCEITIAWRAGSP